MGMFSYFFYDSFLGVAPFSTHKKTITPPRYSHDTVFHWNCFIQMSFKISFSNIFIFGCGSFEKVMSGCTLFIFSPGSPQGKIT